MKHKELEAAEAKIAALLAESEQQRAKTAARLTELKEELAKAEKAAADALTVRNEKAYADARTEQRELLDRIDFNKAQIQRSETEPLLDKKECAAIARAIRAEADESLAVLTRRIGEILVTLQPIMEEANNIAGRTDAAIKALQKKILRDLPNVRNTIYRDENGNCRMEDSYRPAANIAPAATIAMIYGLPEVEAILKEARANADH